MHRFGQIFGVVQSEITISIKIKKKKKKEQIIQHFGKKT